MNVSPSRRFRRVLAGGASLAVLFSTAVAFSPFTGSASATVTAIPSNYFTVVDSGGANDQPGQKDLTQMGRDDSNANFLDIFWSWDDTDFQAQAGDACALFSATTNGYVTYAICGEVVNATAPATGVVLNTGYPLGFTCTPVTHPLDRCDSSTSASIGSTTAGPIVPSDAGPSGTDLITQTDPFVINGSDTTLALHIDRSALPQGANLVNVCTYPSAANGANNDPSDCIVTPGAGFVQIVKNTTGGNGSFDFAVNPGNFSRTVPTTGSPIGTGTSTSISTVAGTNYSAAETVPNNWDLTDATCKLQDNTATGTKDLAHDQVTGITVQVGRLTTCTFSDTRQSGYLQIVKSATAGHNGTQFSYDVSCGTNGSVFSQTNVLVTVDNAGDGHSSALGPITTGTTCTVTEAAKTGWTAAQSVVTSGAIASTNTAASPLQVTFTNSRDHGYLQIVKAATAGHNGTVFTYDVSCGPAGSPVFTQSNVTVTINANGAGTSAVLGPIDTGNTCDVTEHALTGWTPTASSVTSSSITSANTAAAPAQVTFNNTRDQGYLQIKKVATAGHAGTVFTYDVSCGPAGSPVFTASNVTVTIDGTGNGTSAVLGPIDTGNTCAVTEQALAGWTPAASTITSGAIDKTNTTNAPLQVTFNNSRDQGYLKIVKSATAGHAGTVFTYDVSCGPAGSPVFTQSNVTVTVDASGNGSTNSLGPIDTGNTCTVTEHSLTGWTAASSTVTSGSITSANTAAAPLQVTFNNTRDQGYIKIVKSASPGFAGTQFTFDVSCGPAGAPVFTQSNVTVTIDANGNGASGPLGPIDTGNTCTVTEHSLAGWTAASSTVTSGSIALANTSAAPLQVTVTNTRDTGYLQIVKSASAGYGGSTFTFNVSCGPNGSAFAQSNVPVTIDANGNGTSGPIGPIPTGNTCTVTENAAPGWSTTTPTVTSGAIAITNTANAPAQVSFTNIHDIVSLQLVKQAQTASYAAVGDVLTYTYTLTNTGNVTLTAPYAVADDVIAAVDCSAGPASLAPGASFQCTGSYTVTQADLDAGSVTNHAVASATFRGSTVQSNPGEATVPALQTLALGLVKNVAEASYGAAGDVLHYTYTLTNNGNVTLSAPYAVTDDRAATVDCPATPPTIAPGESVICTATYTVTQADVDAGSVTNHATGTAEFQGATVTSNEDEATVPAIQDPLITLTKSVDKDSATYGDTLTYTVSAANTGNLTLTNVIVTDVIPDHTTYVAGSATPGAIASFDPATHTVSWAVGTLAVGQTVDNLTFAVTVDQPNFDPAVGIPAETIDNVALVSADQVTRQPSNHVKTPITAVLGIKVVRHAPPPTLPFTGSSVPLPLAVATGWLLIAAGALVRSRRRGRS